MSDIAKPKKPLYKHVWFWIVIALALLALIIGFASCGSDSDGSTEQSKPTATSSQSTKGTPSSQSTQTTESVPKEWQAALNSAQEYSDEQYMSKQGIYQQLISPDGDKYPADAAKYAVDHVKADWNQNALKTAQEYQSEGDMSNAEIQDQLSSPDGENFTPEQAQWAVAHLQQ